MLVHGGVRKTAKLSWVSTFHATDTTRAMYAKYAKSRAYATNAMHAINARHVCNKCSWRNSQNANTEAVIASIAWFVSVVLHTRKMS